MGLLRHALAALRSLRAAKRPADPIPPAQQSHDTPPTGLAAPRPADGPPVAHDARCVYARLLVQAHWQLADARRENNELTTCIRRLLRQLQVLNALLDPYNLWNAGPVQPAMGGDLAGERATGVVTRATRSEMPALPAPRAPESPFESTPIEKNP